MVEDCTKIGKYGGARVAAVQSVVHVIVIIIVIRLLSQAFSSWFFLEPAVIPTAQASSFTLQCFPYYV
jgi:hypothetical protein